MRIVENSPDRLVLRDRTAWYSLLLFLAAGFMGGYYVLHPAKPGQLLLVAFFAVVGLAFLRSSDVIFDKGARTCLVRRRDMFRVTRRALAFDEITNVRLDISVGGKWNTPTYRPTLVTAADDVPLTGAFEAGQAKYEAMREALVDVVFDRRPRPPAPDPIEGLLKSGRIIGATSILRQREGLSLTEARTRVDQLNGGDGA